MDICNSNLNYLFFTNLINLYKTFEKNIKKYQDAVDKKRNKHSPKNNSLEINKRLNNESSIEDIAEVYCQIEGFNNWEYDTKNSDRIIFKFITSGKKYSKMRKIEVKKLEKWTDDYKHLLRG